MTTIYRVKIWNDTGFTDGCYEVPKGQLTINPDREYRDGLYPSKGNFFSELKIADDYFNLRDASYLEITYGTNNNPSTHSLYGWIDDVELSSDSENYPMTTIHWHIDYWRNYFPEAILGSGIIKRCKGNYDTHNYPLNLPYKYYEPQEVFKTFDETNIWWLIVGYVQGSGQNSLTKYIFEPIQTNNNLDGKLWVTDGINTSWTMGLNNFITGMWDEIIGIDPASITGAFISPVPPAPLSGRGDLSSPLQLGNIHEYPLKINSSFAAGWFEMTPTLDTSIIPIYPIKYEFSKNIGTYNTTKTVVTGFNGEIVGVLPWMMKVDSCQVRLILSMTSAYVEIRLADSWGEDTFLDANSSGLSFTIPCIAVDLSSNSWSSYVYSGQRQYDRTVRQLNTDTSAITGVAGLGNSGLMGGIGGAMSTGNAGAGAVVGMTSGLVSTLSNYAIDNYWKNPELNRLNDTLHAMQSDNIVSSGAGFDALKFGRKPAIIIMKKDEYSDFISQTECELYGLPVELPYSDCQSFVTGGGPIQIDRLVLTGTMPVEAKNYIISRLAKGVYIK